MLNFRIASNIAQQEPDWLFLGGNQHFISIREKDWPFILEKGTYLFY